ncbi:hypothetical protein [Oricola sp.]|uniref:hypothetical protein n=1 Tax=Oricola sp. TaxID=1979950 RepID=UPI0025E123E6|nr:hypothetical protein [Oricola sp.]MCI5073953.1 hypothetical protein [Oricola sp.]
MAKPLKPAEIVQIHALNLSRELGCTDRDIAVAALSTAFMIADEMGDPDGFVAKLTALALERGHLKKGRAL